MAPTFSWGGWLGCGWETSGPSVTYPINGRSFNPPEVSWPTPNSIGIWGAANIFDLTCFWPGHEVVMNLNCIMVACGCCYDGYLDMCWFRGAANYFIYDYYINISSSYDHCSGSWTCQWSSAWSYTGIKLYENPEICCNGDNYCVKTCLDAIGYCTHYFCVCCLQSCRKCLYPPSAAGSLWVEGTCLMYTPTGCANQGGCTYRARMFDDGSTYGSAGIANAGSIWVESGGGCRLYYVDCDGCIRKTKQGDSTGYHNYDAMPCNIASKSGYIWAQSAFNDHAIFFFDSTGQKIRIGPGYLYGDCY